MKDERGREVAEPLRRGGDHCVFHARPFCTRPAEEFTGAAVVVFLDLETSGLDVARDQVVEIAATEAPPDPAAFGASFSTVVSGAPEPGGEAPPAVHGIAAEEIARGPRFPEAWSRFVAFAEGLLDARPREEEHEDSEEEEDEEKVLRPARPAFEPPQLLVLAHNGARFDFALLLFESRRHSLDWSPYRHRAITGRRFQMAFSSCLTRKRNSLCARGPPAGRGGKASCVEALQEDALHRQARGICHSRSELVRL